MPVGNMKKKELAVIIILTVVIAFMDISGIPGALILKGSAWDIDSFIFPLMLNFVLIGILAFCVIRLLCPNLYLGLNQKNLKEGLKKYLLAGIIVGLLSFVAFYIGLTPYFDYKPTVWKLLFEGILYYVGVGIVEELYVRGLFLNAVEELFGKNTNRTEIAIIVSSLVFALGHIPGVLGLGIPIMLFKIITTTGMGLFFGTIYKKTQNLWVPILMHVFIDICALPYCFTTYKGYADISLYMLLVVYIALGAYSIYLLKKE